MTITKPSTSGNAVGGSGLPFLFLCIFMGTVTLSPHLLAKVEWGAQSLVLDRGTQAPCSFCRNRVREGQKGSLSVTLFLRKQTVSWVSVSKSWDTENYTSNRWEVSQDPEGKLSGMKLSGLSFGGRGQCSLTFLSHFIPEKVETGAYWTLQLQGVLALLGTLTGNHVAFEVNR